MNNIAYFQEFVMNLMKKKIILPTYIKLLDANTVFFLKINIFSSF